MFADPPSTGLMMERAARRHHSRANSSSRPPLPHQRPPIVDNYAQISTTSSSAGERGLANQLFYPTSSPKRSQPQYSQHHRAYSLDRPVLSQPPDNYQQSVSNGFYTYKFPTTDHFRTPGKTYSGSHAPSPRASIPPPSPWGGYRSEMGNVTVEAIDCGPFVGRAGALLFLFLAFNVRHRMKVIPANEDLTTRKEILRFRKGGLVLPQWPVCYHDNFALIEMNATLRFLACRLNEYGVCQRDPTRDYRADMILEKLAYWRDTLSQLLGEYPEGVSATNYSDASVNEYITTQRKAFYDLFEFLLRVHDTDFFIGDEVSWVDPAIYSVLMDDLTLMHFVRQDRGGDPSDEDETLNEHPLLMAYMQRILQSCPLLERWISEHRRVWLGNESQ